MTKKLLDSGEELSTGLHPALPADRIPFWEDGQNLFWRDGGIEAIPGQLILCDKVESAPVVGAIEAELTDNAGGHRKTLFWGTQTKLFRWREGEQLAVDVSRTAGGAYGTGASMDQTSLNVAFRWSFSQWGEWVVATNGLDTPQIYKATDATPKFADMTGLNFARAEIFRRLAVYLVAFNTDMGVDFAQWSDEDDLGVWVPSGSNSAGSQPLRNLNSPIMAAEDIGENTIGIYGRDQFWLASYVGPPRIIGIKHTLDGIGAWGKSAVATVGRNHYGWGPNGIFQCNGSDSRYLDTPSLKRYLDGLPGQLPVFDKQQASKIVVWPWPRLNSVVFFYPFTAGNSRWNSAAVLFNYEQGTWWKLGFGRQSATSGKVFNFPISIDENGQIYALSDDAPPPLTADGPMFLSGMLEMMAGIGEMSIGDIGMGGYFSLTEI